MKLVEVLAFLRNHPVQLTLRNGTGAVIASPGACPALNLDMLKGVYPTRPKFSGSHGYTIYRYTHIYVHLSVRRIVVLIWAFYVEHHKLQFELEVVDNPKLVCKTYSSVG